MLPLPYVSYLLLPDIKNQAVGADDEEIGGLADAAPPVTLTTFIAFLPSGPETNDKAFGRDDGDKSKVIKWVGLIGDLFIRPPFVPFPRFIMRGYLRRRNLPVAVSRIYVLEDGAALHTADFSLLPSFGHHYVPGLQASLPDWFGKTGLRPLACCLKEASSLR
jgi:hypothetical protein